LCFLPAAPLVDELIERLAGFETHEQRIVAAGDL
jgi:hypothetical protein